MERILRTLPEINTQERYKYYLAMKIAIFKEKLAAFREVNNNNRREKNPSSGNSQVLSLSWSLPLEFYKS